MLQNERGCNQQLDADEKEEECSLELTRLLGQHKLMSGKQEGNDGKNKQEYSHV